MLPPGDQDEVKLSSTSS